MYFCSSNQLIGHASQILWISSLRQDNSTNLVVNDMTKKVNHFFFILNCGTICVELVYYLMVGLSGDKLF